LFDGDSPPRELPGHSDVHAMTFSPDGETLASGGDDRIVHLWNARDGSVKASLTGHREPIWVLEFSPDGKWLASAGDEKGVRLWHLPSGRVRELPAEDLVYASSFSGDGRWFAWTTGDRTVSLVRLDSEEAPRLIGGHAAAVRAVALSPDGRRLVTGSDDHTARLCRLDDKSVCIILPHGGPVRMAHFSADGRVLITSSDDRTVRLWDVESAAELSLFRAEHTYVSARLSQDAGYLTAIFKDEPFVRVWRTALAPPAASAAWLDQLTSIALVPGAEIASRLTAADRR
jgi:WD40 repeat protein